MKKILKIETPQTPLPLVLDSPHSGHDYPADFLDNARFTADALRKYEDNYIDDIFSGAPKLGAAFLCALFPRTYIDPNRAIDDIDPELLAAPWPEDKYGLINPTIRSKNGHGIIRRLLSEDIELHKRKLSTAEIMHRITEYYAPYHNALADLLDRAHKDFGAVWHINCHSMPSRSAIPNTPLKLIGNTRAPVDFCIGDRSGTTSGKDFTHMLRDFLKAKGYRVSINDPYQGVELVQRYSDPLRGRHSVQLEINKALYMNERTDEKTSGYDALKRDMNDLVAHTADYIEAKLVPLAAD